MTCYEIHTLASKQFDNFLALVWTSFKDFQAVEPGLPGGNAQVLECEDFWDISMLLIRHRQQQQQDAELGHIAKNRQKRDSKNSWNRRTILVPATVWQILNVKLRQPETEVIWIWRNFHLVKSPGQTYVLAGFQHLEPLWDAKKEKKHCSSINWGISSNFFDSYCETELNVSGLDENSLVGRTKVFIDIRGSLQIQPTCCLVSKRHLNPFFNRTWDLFRTSRVVRWRKSFRRWLYRQFLFLPPSVFLLSRHYLVYLTTKVWIL